MRDSRRQFNRRMSDPFWELLPRVQARLGVGSDTAVLEVLVREKARELGIEWHEPERFPVKHYENDEAPRDTMENHDACGAV